MRLTEESFARVAEAFESIVICKVGPELESFILHEVLVTKESDFIRVANSERWQGSTPKLIDLRFEDVASFKVFARWLYTEELHIRIPHHSGQGNKSAPSHPTSQLDESDAKVDAIVNSTCSSLCPNNAVTPAATRNTLIQRCAIDTILIPAYVLGHKLLAQRFCDDIVSYLIAYWDGGKRLPSEDDIRFVYEHTLRGAPLRRVIVDLYVLRAAKTEDSTKMYIVSPVGRKHHHEFLEELAHSLLLNVVEKSTPHSDYLLPLCKYHSHQEGYCEMNVSLHINESDWSFSEIVEVVIDFTGKSFYVHPHLTHRMEVRRNAGTLQAAIRTQASVLEMYLQSRYLGWSLTGLVSLCMRRTTRNSADADRQLADLIGVGILQDTLSGLCCITPVLDGIVNWHDITRCLTPLDLIARLFSTPSSKHFEMKTLIIMLIMERAQVADIDHLPPEAAFWFARTSVQTRIMSKDHGNESQFGRLRTIGKVLQMKTRFHEENSAEVSSHFQHVPLNSNYENFPPKISSEDTFEDTPGTPGQFSLGSATMPPRSEKFTFRFAKK